MGSSVSVAERLHERGADSWRTAVTHVMVREIADGTLPHETFRRYFEQNVLYLGEYARAIALIVAKTMDPDAVATLTAFQSQIVDNEVPANRRFLERLGGSPSGGAGGRAMHPTTYAYTRHLLATCALGDPAEGLAAVLPCQWSYGELARPLMDHPPDDRIYSDWIGMFGNDEYDDLIGRTTALLDAFVGSPDEHRLQALSDIFDRSTRYEADFWDMAYGLPSAGSADGREA